MEKVNYMDEIRKIEDALESIESVEDTKNNKTNTGIKSRLEVMLNNLEDTTDQMAAYIRGDWDNTDILHLKQVNMFNTNHQEYLSGLTKLLRMERIMLICTTQTPDEKAYFLREYTKYKREHGELGNSKVR
jgi:uncharacterized protein YutE (UPF0331/DUF86 family)